MNPFKPQQNPFESIEGISNKPVVKQSVKAVGDTVKAMAGDAKQQLTGDYGGDTAMEQAQSQQKILSSQQQQTIQQQSQQNLALTRQNLEKINNELKTLRQKEEQKKQQEVQADTKKKEQKKDLEEKKKEDPAWKKLLKGKSGSKEGNVRASG